MSLKLEVNFAATLKDGPAIQPNKAPIGGFEEVRSKKLQFFIPKEEFVEKPIFSAAEERMPQFTFFAVSAPRFTYDHCQSKEGKIEKLSGIALWRHLKDDTARIAHGYVNVTKDIFFDDLMDNLLLVHRPSQKLDHLNPSGDHNLFIRVNRCLFDPAKPLDPLVVTVIYGQQKKQ